MLADHGCYRAQGDEQSRKEKEEAQSSEVTRQLGQAELFSLKGKTQRCVICVQMLEHQSIKRQMLTRRR